MARPQKEGLEYFSLDVDFFSDRKIKILKGRFGADGVTYYLYLLCEIYKGHGYYLDFDADFDYITCSPSLTSSLAPTGRQNWRSCPGWRRLSKSQTFAILRGKGNQIEILQQHNQSARLGANGARDIAVRSV